MRPLSRYIPTKRYLCTSHALATSSSTSSSPSTVPFTPRISVSTTATKNIIPSTKTPLSPQNTVSQSSTTWEPHFYMNKVLDKYASQKATPVTLRQLLFYERHRTKKRLLTSANYVRKELPIRIAHRLREFQNLPFIVGVNPHMQQVYRLYWEAFDRLRAVPPIETLDQNQRFCEMLHTSLQAHLVVIPQLALGIQECDHQHINREKRDKFMNATLRSRISRRVLAEQHLILSDFPPVFTSASSSTTTKSNYHLQHHHHHEDDAFADTGVMIFQHCSARSTLATCIKKAHLYGSDIDFAYVGDHIEYILYQLLLNAMQHSNNINLTDGILSASTSSSSPSPPPIRVTLCANDTDVFFRISDQAGGIASNVFQNIWSFGQHASENFHHVKTWAATVMDEQQQHIGGSGNLKDNIPMNMPLGMGLPMSKVYAEYWGGDINIQTLHGFGSDAYLRIPKLGDQMEHLDVEDHDSDLHVELDSGSYVTHRRRFVI
ncbi:branched-chain alpha-ketoacid dehydrogenase [Absidia repens]|uniref:Protein-serine/threonine kinase n=1 Tax=Absidia repens TaxID=90262 RepID=A0A1X2IJM5_9FUNG|nr:branched-chain alpha-ketoacid dehydrogenase [Absidia repens]